MNMLAYCMITDTIDEYLKLRKTIALECLEKYCEGIIDGYRIEFLYRPTIIDTQHLLAQEEECGFPSMLGSIDCMHQKWMIYLMGWEGQFTSGHQTSYHHPSSRCVQGPLDMVCFFLEGGGSWCLTTISMC
jgi:hypothetical protein